MPYLLHQPRLNNIKEITNILLQFFQFSQYYFNLTKVMEEDEARYAIFIDHSSSVNGKNSYWQVVGSIIKNKDFINRFFFWNDSTTEVNFEIVKQSQAYLKGHGGTDTTAVARKICHQKLTHVIIITDAEIDGITVSKTDNIIEHGASHGFRIMSSICYIISHKNRNINMSSICPFIRNGESHVYLKSKGSDMKLIASHKMTDQDYIKNLNHVNLRNFEFQIKTIESIIIRLNMGKAGNPAIRQQLLALKKKLVYQLSIKNKQQNYSLLIQMNLEYSDTKAALVLAQQLTYEYMSYEYSMDIESKINYLVSLCGDLRNQFDYNTIHSNKLKNAVEAQQRQIEKDIPVEELTMNIIECPIIMDEDVPQILIDEGQPVLLGFDKKIVDDIATCPLRILNYPEVKAKFKSRLSNYIGTKLNGQITQNPFTRKKLLGAIPLGCHHSHVEAGNYTIAHMVSGGKILGNIHLYYAVIWYLINEGLIEYLKPIKENAAEHLVFRLKNSFTTASMCGLPQFVATRVTTDVAIWYIVNSGYFNLPTNRDVFRYHIFNMEPMVKILRVLKYPLHKGVKEHFFRTRAMLKMLYKLKKYNPNFQKGYHTIFRGLYQNGFFVDITNVSLDFWEREVCAMFIPVDGAADQNQIKRIRQIIPKCCKYLSNQEIYYISTLLDESKSASDIALDYNAIIPPLPKAQVKWECYGLKQWNNMPKICPGSMRPYLKVNNKHWKQIVREIYGVNEIDELFSGCRNFERFVVKYKRYPISVDELAIYYYNRFINSGKESTLPFMTQKWTERIIEEYTNAGYKCKNSKKDINRIYQSFLVQNQALRALMESD